MNLRVTPPATSGRVREQGWKAIRPRPRPVLPWRLPGKRGR
jgi:hypothetical protein